MATECCNAAEELVSWQTQARKLINGATNYFAARQRLRQSAIKKKSDAQSKRRGSGVSATSIPLHVLEESFDDEHGQSDHLGKILHK